MQDSTQSDDATDVVEPEVQEETVVEAVEVSSPAAGSTDIPDEVVTAILQGKYTTDAATQARRLEAEGYDVEAVKAALKRRMDQRYE